MATTFTYDDTKTAQENFDIFLEGQSEADYTLGDYSGTAQGDQDLYTDIKVKVAKEAKKISDFNLAKEAAFNTLAQQYDADKISLGQTWQTYEDNDYTIPQ